MQQVPIVFAILNIAIRLQNLGEEFTQEVVVRCLFEAKLANVVEINTKLLCKDS